MRRDALGFPTAAGAASGAADLTGSRQPVPQQDREEQNGNADGGNRGPHGEPAEQKPVFCRPWDMPVPWVMHLDPSCAASPWISSL
jgi:hypothetical protein